MAVFNPILQEGNPPNSINASGGPIVRRGAGTLIEGLARTGEAVVGALDFRNQYRLREEIRTGVEIVRDQFGVNAASDTADTLFGNYHDPEALEDAYGQLDTLQQAFANGTIRESHYYAQLQSLVRAVKSRYPGYEAEIDDAIRNITGVDPANSLIGALINEGQAMGGADNENYNRDRAFIFEHAGELELVYPGFSALPEAQQIAMIQPGQPVFNAWARNQSIQAQRTTMEADIAVGNMSALDALEADLNNVNSGFTTTMTELAGEGGFPTPEEILQSLQESGVFGNEPIDYADAVNILNQYISTLRTNMTAVLDQEQYRSVREEGLKLIDSYMTIWESYIDAIVNEDYGLAAAGEMVLGIQDSQVRNLINEQFGGGLTVMEIMNESIPPAIMDYIVQNNLAPIVQIATALGTIATNAALANAAPEVVDFYVANGAQLTDEGTIDLNTLPVALGNMGLTREQREQTMQEQIQMQIDIIRGQVTGEVPLDPEVLDGAIRTLFVNSSGGFSLNNVNPDEWQDTYRYLTSRAIVDVVNNTGDPELIQGYQAWAVREFRITNFQDVNGINAIPQDSEAWNYVSLVFNQATNRFEIQQNVPDDQIRQTLAAQGGITAIDAAGPDPLNLVPDIGLLRQSVDRLNRTLPAVGYILESGEQPMEMDERTINSLLGITIPYTVGNIDVLGNPVIQEGAAAQQPNEGPEPLTGNDLTDTQLIRMHADIAAMPPTPGRLLELRQIERLLQERGYGPQGETIDPTTGNPTALEYAEPDGLIQDTPAQEAITENMGEAQGVDMSLSYLGDTNYHRGVRNNNPGNIEAGRFTQSLPGYLGSDGRFAQFQTAAQGIYAMARLLTTYQTRYGLTTVGQMIDRWAPPVENNTASYAQTVARAMGVSVDTPIDVSNIESLAPMIAAMIRVENATNPYSEEFIRRAIQG